MFKDKAQFRETRYTQPTIFIFFALGYCVKRSMQCLPGAGKHCHNTLKTLPLITSKDCPLKRRAVTCPVVQVRNEASGWLGALPCHMGIGLHSGTQGLNTLLPWVPLNRSRIFLTSSDLSGCKGQKHQRHKGVHCPYQTGLLSEWEFGKCTSEIKVMSGFPHSTQQKCSAK